MARLRTSATAGALLAVLTLALTPSALAQSAGDDQYADPLAGGGGQPRQQPPPPRSDGAGETMSPAPATPDPATSSQSAPAAAPQAALPHTGADPRQLAGLGLALLAAGALALGLPRRSRHGRG